MKQNRFRKPILVAVTAFAAFFLVGVGSSAAMAGQATSANGYYTVNGKQYVNRAVINTGSGYAYAVTINLSLIHISEPTRPY